MIRGILFTFSLLTFSAWGEELQITVQAGESPESRPWAEKAAGIAQEWYPKVEKVLASDGFTAPGEMTIFIKKSDKGVAHASGNKITVMSSWIEKKPDDFGLIVHELTHVIQRYPGGKGPGWITEGIADYIRWALYEEKPLEWFPRPLQARKNGYEKSYRITAGFFLWLETGEAKGLVSRLNQQMRAGAYTPEFFEKETGKPLSDLWDEYFSHNRGEVGPAADDL